MQPSDADKSTQDTYQMPKTIDCARSEILGVQLSKNADQTIQRPISAEMESQNSRFWPSATFQDVSAKI